MILLLRFLPYIAGVLAFLGVATAAYQFVDNRWATDAGIAEGRKRESTKLQPKIDALAAQVNAFVTEGKAAEQRKVKQEADDKSRKEKADAENKVERARLLADVDRVRRERDVARASIVPKAPAGSKCPDGQACFERAELERALRDYRSAIRGLVDEGSAVTTDLNTAKRWARDEATR